MLFHVGAIWRLYETGVLQKLKRISSVSGGSIAAGVLRLGWAEIIATTPDRERLERALVDPLRALAGQTIDARAILLGLLLPGKISDRVAAFYRPTFIQCCNLAGSSG